MRDLRDVSLIEVPDSWLSEWTAQFLVSSLMLLVLRASKTGGKLSPMNRKLAMYSCEHDTGDL